MNKSANITRAKFLWLFFVELWDDNVTSTAAEKVLLDARTIRVLRNIVGDALLISSMEKWEACGTIVILGDFKELAADAACVEVRGYVQEGNN